MLRGLPAELTLPSDRPRPPSRAAVETSSSSLSSRNCTPRSTRSPRRPARACAWSLQAALATLLTRLGAGTDLPIGALVAGREDDRLADLVGCFFNTVVLRTDTSGEPSFTELLSRVLETDLSAFEHQDAAFADVLAEVPGWRGPQVMLVHHEAIAALELSGQSALRVRPPRRHQRRPDAQLLRSPRRSLVLPELRHGSVRRRHRRAARRVAARSAGRGRGLPGNPR
ncbi:condensation domain-containing protein [Amycolatopsis lurida]